MKHSQEDRMDGKCVVCTLRSDQIKKCCGFAMIGDRACDTRHLIDYGKIERYRLCKNHINYKKWLLKNFFYIIIKKIKNCFKFT
jgi:hypothetical protein